MSTTFFYHQSQTRTYFVYLLNKQLAPVVAPSKVRLP